MMSGIEEFDSFYSVLKEFSSTTQDKPDFQKSIENINGWVDEQRRKGEEEKIKNVGEALKITVNAIEKFKTGDPYDVTCGTLEIISSIAAVAGGPYGVAFSALCSIVGAIVSANKPAKPSVVEQLANVVHSALNDFHNKLQIAELSGLKGRVQRQLTQLHDMKDKEELDDPHLWNHYDHFMGELSYRVDAPLQFEYEKNLEQDPDLADFRKAIVMYCNAYTCFMGLLTVAKAKFQEFDNRDMVSNIDRLIDHRAENIKVTLKFLSDKNYLKFIGRLPSEGGKLTKILLLTRHPAAKKVVESVRGSLNLSSMAESDEVEKAVEKVSRQSVLLKFQREKFPDLRSLCVVATGVPAPSTLLFINETDFPMRIVSGTVGWSTGNLKFQQDVDPHSCYYKAILSFTGKFSTGGYIKIAYDRKLSAKEDPNEDNVGIIEFALSSSFATSVKINIQDKTDSERTQGKDTHTEMTNGERKTLYWKKRNVHYLAKAEVLLTTVERVLGWFTKFDPLNFGRRSTGTWCFIIQDFDPEQDMVENEK